MSNLEKVLRDLRLVNVMARRKAMQEGQKVWFYRLKNLTMKWLYLNGYCIEVKRSVQEFPCWTCDGDGCFRCDGTGVHHRVHLFSFRFRVKDFYIAWHIPEQLADWDVALTESVEEGYREPISDAPKLGKWEIARILLRAWLFLKLVGMDGPPPLGVWPWSWRTVRKWMYWRVAIFGDWLYERKWKSIARRVWKVQHWIGYF